MSDISAGQSPNSERIIFAHRGLNHQAPENTLSAFRHAYRAGVRWLETDVDVIADSSVIICHDSTLDRTTNCHGFYNDMCADDIARVDAGAWFSPEFRGEPLPTLEQLIDFLNETGMHCNIELKANEVGAARSLMLVEGVGKALSRLTSASQIIVSSFSHILLDRFHQRFPDYPLGCLWEQVPDDWRSVMEMVGASYVHPPVAGLTSDLVRDFREAGYGVNVWTVNNRAVANTLFNWGVTGIFTDIADKMIDFDSSHVFDA